MALRRPTCWRRPSPRSRRPGHSLRTCPRPIVSSHCISEPITGELLLAAEPAASLRGQDDPDEATHLLPRARRPSIACSCDSVACFAPLWQRWDPHSAGASQRLRHGLWRGALGVQGPGPVPAVASAGGGGAGPLWHCLPPLAAAACRHLPTCYLSHSAALLAGFPGLQSRAHTRCARTFRFGPPARACHLLSSLQARKYVPAELPLVSLFGWTLGGFYLARYSCEPRRATPAATALPRGCCWPVAGLPLACPTRPEPDPPLPSSIPASLQPPPWAPLMSVWRWQAWPGTSQPPAPGRPACM